ncbi:hypothetical protein JWG41_07355 [Leptospira sp. 201903075]|uniref:hypothetical protein n=1 Tax=Leptospira chreensis TaxID=2810035 RepID=UPI0019643EC7|nr:hypothetical protein [Leptospira chreensis]MBM9590256.1 hypothetical protein [Leptospira chreensis]
MAKSLLEKDPNGFLYIFAFDDECYDNLRKISISNTKVISLKEFENDKLLSVKSSRSAGEYCWTCTPWTIKYCIEKFEIDHCTYVDADLFFFSNPQPILDEVSSSSVLLTEHRYSERYDQTKTSGRFCVQFLMIRNNSEGMVALNWWADRCIEWCYARTEDGKFGDQMYLDDWETRFSGVHVLKHLGGGVAPWNFEKYLVTFSDGSSFVLKEIASDHSFMLIFYHFHEVKLREAKIKLLTNYYFSKENFAVHRFYYKELESNFQFFRGLNLKSEGYSDLTLNLLENIYEERDELSKLYRAGKSRLLRFWFLSLTGGIIFTVLLLFIEYLILAKI